MSSPNSGSPVVKSGSQSPQFPTHPPSQMPCPHWNHFPIHPESPTGSSSPPLSYSYCKQCKCNQNKCTKDDSVKHDCNCGSQLIGEKNGETKTSS